MKAGKQAGKKGKTSKGGVKTQAKRDLLVRKAIEELKRESGQEFYFIEGACFDYCC